MKWLWILLALASVGLLILARRYDERAAERRYLISDALKEAQAAADCDKAVFQRGSVFILQRLKEEEGNLNLVVWVGWLGLALSIAGLIGGRSKQNTKVQPSAGGNAASPRASA